MCWYEPIKNYSVVGRFVGGKIVDPPTPLYRGVYQPLASEMSALPNPFFLNHHRRLTPRTPHLQGESLAESNLHSRYTFSQWSI